MRLLKTGSYKLGCERLEMIEEFGRDIPNYAILSHTWGSDEVTYEHVRNSTAHKHDGYEKIVRAIRQAAAGGFGYIWIDTCCIDKSSSAELSEALNSMYAWYQKADICYALLEDVSRFDTSNFAIEFKSSRWFTRGWTLQELLAPSHVQFFGKAASGAWVPLGDRVSLQLVISEITSVGVQYLTGLQDARRASVARRMSWAAGRQTKREEDIAYCLLGLFSINMPLLYGEGSRAFLRLQEEILKRSNDQSIFAWADPVSGAEAEPLNADSRFVKIDWFIRKSIGGQQSTHTLRTLDQHGLLADSPAAFACSGAIRPCLIPGSPGATYQMSNQGISITLPVMRFSANFSIALLECSRSFASDHNAFLGIFLVEVPGPHQYARVHCRMLVDGLSPKSDWPKHIFVRQEVVDEASSRAARLELCLLSCSTEDYRATDITCSSDIYDSQHILDTQDSRKTPACSEWAPAGFSGIIRIPDSTVTFFAAIELKRKSDDERLVILIGTGDDVGTNNLWFAVTDSSNLYDHKALQEEFRRQAHPSSQSMPANGHRVTLSVNDARVDSGYVTLPVSFDIEVLGKKEPKSKTVGESSDSKFSSHPVHWRRRKFSELLAKGAGN